MASLPSLSARQEAKTLMVGVGLRPVFQDKISDGEYSGLDIELGMAIAAAAGYKVSLLDYPWPRIVHLMKSGKVDLTFSAGKAGNRLAWARFTQEHFRYGRNYLYVLKSRFHEFQNLQNLEQLQPTALSIGVQRGYQYSPEFEELVSRPWFSKRLQVLKDPDIIIEALLKGRVDAILGSEYGTADVLRQFNLTDKVKPVFNLMPDDNDSKTYMMFSKSSVSHEVVKDFDDAIRRLRDAGALQAITSKYEISE